MAHALSALEDADPDVRRDRIHLIYLGCIAYALLRPAPLEVCLRPGKVDIELPGTGNSNFQGARLVHQIISMIQWIKSWRWWNRMAHALSALEDADPDVRRDAVYPTPLSLNPKI